MELKPGYHIFYTISNDVHGYALAADELESQIKEAEKTFNIEFLGGPQFKDEERRICFVAQACILREKEVTQS